MKKIEIVRGKNYNIPLLSETDFFADGLSENELAEIKGGQADMKCNKGYSHTIFKTKCSCGYDSEDSAPPSPVNQ